MRGQTLARLLSALARANRRLAPPLAVWVAAETAAGLHAAHETRGDDGELLDVVHRDVSPQNVLVSMRDWAHQAGLMHLSQDLVVRAHDPELLRRFVQDPGVKGHVRRVLDDHAVQLRGGASAPRMRSLLRELGFLIELE